MVRSSLLALAQAATQAARQHTGAAARTQRQQAVQLTDAAAERIKELLQERHKVRMLAWLPRCRCNTLCGAAVRCMLAWVRWGSDMVSLGSPAQGYLKFGVRTRGCSGLSYTLNYSGKRRHDGLGCAGMGGLTRW